MGRSEFYSLKFDLSRYYNDPNTVRRPVCSTRNNRCVYYKSGLCNFVPTIKFDGRGKSYIQMSGLTEHQKKCLVCKYWPRAIIIRAFIRSLERAKKMIKEVLDKPSGYNYREVAFRYDPNDEHDVALLNKIKDLLSTKQRLCSNCKNLVQEGYFCGYTAHCCKIHGNIEAADHPHHDGDGSKCDDYFPKWHLEEQK